MRKMLIFPLAIAIAVLLTRCAITKAIFSESPSQYVVVVNTIPNTVLDVVGSGVYGELVFGKGIRAGMQCRVPAALFPQSQVIVVTIHVYNLQNGSYLGSRSRTFGFSCPQGQNYQNQVWDVVKWDLARN